MPQDKSTLVQVMAWCRQVPSHYLGQCWLSSLSPYGVVRPQWVNHQWHSTEWYAIKILSSVKICFRSGKCVFKLSGPQCHNTPRQSYIPFISWVHLCWARANYDITTYHDITRVSRPCRSHLFDRPIGYISTYRADSRFAPSQWEMALLCNDISHWLGANLESALYISSTPIQHTINISYLFSKEF